jgi:SpoVK/Ycf46/Vps4 family AAA+-type ATPase
MEQKIKTSVGVGMSGRPKRSRNEDEDDEDMFNIGDYKITDLKSLIDMIEDYIMKPLPPKRMRKSLPSKMNKLPFILDHLQELNDLIGLTDLKQQLMDQIIFFIQGVDENIMLHTVIEGPPGTGKTTVANIMANIYANIGILKKRKCTIVKREDLIGQYLGETTIKTGEMLESCKNGVMLIDEAYSLGSGERGDSYAKEAVDAINQYLTENADKLVCIIAGYKKELNECFFSQNPGLRRRFPWTFTIENFTPDELSRIFFSMIEQKDWETDISEKDSVGLFTKNKQYFDGNGGDIANLISKAQIINVRKNFGKENTYTITQEDLKEAIDIFTKTKISRDTSPPFGMYN